MTTINRPDPRTWDKHSWRMNVRMSDKYSEYWDWFINGEYQHAWIRYTKGLGGYALEMPGQRLGTFDTFAEAADHIAAVAVVERFRRAG